MIGAIAGDIIGSRFEHSQAANYDFELFHRHCQFTDDTVCSLAVAKALMDDYKFEVKGVPTVVVLRPGPDGKKTLEMFVLPALRVAAVH